MKKSKLWLALVAVFVVLVGAGCSHNSNSSSNNGDYTTYMNRGKDYVDSKEYSKAEDQFEKAHEVKATDESKIYADQADEMADAKDDISEYEFTSALKSLNKVIYKNNGYSVMVKQAKKLYKTIDEVNNNIKNEIDPLYDQAQTAFKNKDYQQAEELCTQILNLPYINTKYYKQIRNDVKDLLNDAQDANDDSDSDSSSKKNSSNKENSNSNNSNSSTNSASNSNSMTVGGQAVTARVIAQVRERLASLGASTSAWSDQDVVNFMNQAAQNGHTTIDSYTQSDVNNFNK